MDKFSRSFVAMNRETRCADRLAMLAWRAFAVTVVALVFRHAALSAQSDTVWQYTTPSQINFTRVDPAGHLLVATEHVVVALNSDSGTVAWTYPVEARDRRDGRELGRVWFDEKSPKYGIDDASGTVYVRAGDDRVVARRFRKGTS